MMPELRTIEALSKVVIHRGDKGLMVRWLQAKLSCAIDGAYGNAPYHDLYDHIVAYQKYKGLTRDGIVGKATWKSLLAR